MATKTQKTAPPEEGRKTEGRELQTIESLCKQHKVKAPVYAGTCTANGWRPGRMMTEAEFLAAVEQFTGSPMGGSRKKGAEK